MLRKIISSTLKTKKNKEKHSQKQDRWFDEQRSKIEDKILNVLRGIGTGKKIFSTSTKFKYTN